MNDCVTCGGTGARTMEILGTVYVQTCEACMGSGEELYARKRRAARNLQTLIQLELR